MVVTTSHRVLGCCDQWKDSYEVQAPNEYPKANLEFALLQKLVLDRNKTTCKNDHISTQTPND